jgi:hypothetical protein
MFRMRARPRFIKNERGFLQPARLDLGPLDRERLYDAMGAHAAYEETSRGSSRFTAASGRSEEASARAVEGPGNTRFQSSAGLARRNTHAVASPGWRFRRRLREQEGAPPNKTASSPPATTYKNRGGRAPQPLRPVSSPSVPYLVPHRLCPMVVAPSAQLGTSLKACPSTTPAGEIRFII